MINTCNFAIVTTLQGAQFMTHWIFSFDEDVVDRLSRVSIDVLRDTQLSGLRVDFEQRVFVLRVEAVRQREEQRAELGAVCICGNNLNRRKRQFYEPSDTKLLPVSKTTC